MVFARDCSDAFKKDTPCKEIKWVKDRKIKDYLLSIKRGWKSPASSKAKSTQWLLINHSLPVKSRINREVVTQCEVCGGLNVDHEHVFKTCSRAKEIWSLTNSGLGQNYGFEVPISFEDALNPGSLGEGYASSLADALAASATHHIWADHCSREFGKNSPPPAKSVANAILGHFSLLIKAELGSLQADLAWWECKREFRPGIMSNPKVNDIFLGIKARIKDLRTLEQGSACSEEFKVFAPFSSTGIVWVL